MKVEEPGSTETILSDFIISSLFSIISTSYGITKKYLFDLVFYIFDSWKFSVCYNTFLNNLSFFNVLFENFISPIFLDDIFNPWNLVIFPLILI